MLLLTSLFKENQILGQCTCGACLEILNNGNYTYENENEVETGEVPGN